MQDKTDDLQRDIRNEMELIGDPDNVMNTFLEKDLPELSTALQESSTDRQMTEDMLA